MSGCEDRTFLPETQSSYEAAFSLVPLRSHHDEMFLNCSSKTTADKCPGSLSYNIHISVTKLQKFIAYYFCTAVIFSFLIFFFLLSSTISTITSSKMQRAETTEAVKSRGGKVLSLQADWEAAKQMKKF